MKSHRFATPREAPLELLSIPVSEGSAMGTLSLRFAIIGITLFTCASVAQSAATLRSISEACSNEPSRFGGICSQDFHDGSPAFSSARRRDLYVPPGGGLSGWDYAGEANAKAGLANFAMYARATGQRHDLSSSYIGPSAMIATALVMYHDEIAVAGTGFGTIVVPWHVTGGFLLVAHGDDLVPPQGIFGATFCQSIPLGVRRA